MKKYFLMDCHTVMDSVYEAESDASLPLLTQIQTGLHLFFCSSCARELDNLRRVEEIMKTDFLPPAPEFEDLLMERLYEEKVEENTGTQGLISLRGWVIIGFFVLLSLSSSFFGINFVQIADSEGLSFLLPLGLTIGIVVTCYGAFFIGSHLKELSTWFRLR